MSLPGLSLAPDFPERDAKPSTCLCARASLTLFEIALDCAGGLGEETFGFSILGCAPGFLGAGGFGAEVFVITVLLGGVPGAVDIALLLGGVPGAVVITLLAGGVPGAVVILLPEGGFGEDDVERSGVFLIQARIAAETSTLPPVARSFTPGIAGRWNGVPS